MIDVLIVLGGLWLAAFGICAVLFAVAFFFGAPISAYRHKRREERTARTMAAFEEQGGVCAICGNKCTSGRTLSVDHDHSCCPGSASCGKCIRGLLCTRCNMGLGYFLDDANRLRAAVSYLSGSDSVE